LLAKSSITEVDDEAERLSAAQSSAGLSIPFLRRYLKALKKNNCFSMCEIDLPLSGRMNDKQLFAHGQSAIFS
jgi:hypothetical protein